MGFPGSASGKEPACQCWRRKRLRVRSLDGEDPLQENTLVWRIPETEEPGGYSP